MNIYIDTCVLPRSRLDAGRIYRERYGSSLGFELLMMFDLPSFEDSLKQNLELYAEGPLNFHEPVWGVDHAVPRGSVPWEEGMYHLRLTQKYAAILHPPTMVVHLSNGPVLPGIRVDRTQLLDQQEFTDLCRSRKLPVLIDVGHANANRWDLPKLIRNLGSQIEGFHLHNNDGVHDLHNRLRDGTLSLPALIPCMEQYAPDAMRVIEYTRPPLHGEPLLEDIAYLQKLSEKPDQGE